MALVTQRPVCFSNRGLGSTIATVPSGKESVESTLDNFGRIRFDRV